MRKLLVAGITLFWLCMMLRVVSKDVLTEHTEKTGYRRVLLPWRKEYSAKYEVRFSREGEELPIGQLTEYFDYNPDGTFAITQTLTLELSKSPELLSSPQKDSLLELLGGRGKARIIIQTRIDRSYQLDSFELRADIGWLQVIATGKVVRDFLRVAIQLFGEKKLLRFLRDKSLLPFSMDGERITREVPWATDRVLTIGVGTFIPVSRLRVGKRFRLSFFDVFSLQKIEVEFYVFERERISLGSGRVSCFRIEASSGTVKLILWTSPDGELLKARLPLGFSIIKLE